MRDLKEMKMEIRGMMNESHPNFIKGLFSIETGIEDEEKLNDMYDKYMETDGYDLLSADILDIASINDLDNKKTDSDLVNLIGYVTKDVESVVIKTKENKFVEVANFSIVLENTKGRKEYSNLNAYEDKIETYKKGDLIKVFGKEKITIGDDGRKYKSINVLKSELIKERTQENDDKKSTLDSINTLKEKTKDQESKPIDDVIKQFELGL